MPPKVLARNADRTGGVLPVPAAARSTPKQPAARLKLEVRRLPPGLTLTEFEAALGDEWKLNNGKVDWREYRQGKTRAPGSGKWPEQSRCYVHLVNEACVSEFEKRFLEVVFHDKAGTHKNPDLKHLQPTLGFAPNQRTPLQQAKNRTDNRQGTIDQDPEFIAFLEAETQPISKPSIVEGSDKENDKKEAVKTTPLIEDLRERKANKAKAAQAKAEKAERDKKDTKGAEKEAEKEKPKDAKGNPQQQQKVEQAAKDAAKVLNKQAAGKQQQSQQTKQAASPAKSKKQAVQQSPKQQNATPVPTGPANPAPQRDPQRQRGNADGIKKMLQKDLGIKPKAEATASSTPNTSKVRSPPPAAAKAATQTPTPSKASTQPKATPSPAPPASDSKTSSTKAYLKHANPSQGMTEMLIQQALTQYGEMNNVTIDPRKGTAIAVFKTNEGLKKALEAKKVEVAKGAVEVLEFRERGNASGGGGAGGAGGGRGGFRGGRGGRGRGGGGAGNAGAGASAIPGTGTGTNAGSAA